MSTGLLQSQTYMYQYHQIIINKSEGMTAHVLIAHIDRIAAGLDSSAAASKSVDVCGPSLKIVGEFCASTAFPSEGTCDGSCVGPFVDELSEAILGAEEADVSTVSTVGDRVGATVVLLFGNGYSLTVSG